MAVQFGKMNSRLTFLKRGNVDGETNEGGYGGNDEPTDFYSCACSVYTLQGREYFSAAAVQAERNTRFVIRYPKGVNLSSDMLVRHKGRMYEIVAPLINDNEKDQTMTVICQELLTGG